MSNDLVTVTIPRSALTMVAPPPEYVSTATCLEVLGVPANTFAKWAKAGAFAAAKEGRLWLARLADVRVYLDSRAKVHERRVRPRVASGADDDLGGATGVRRV